MFLVGGSFTFFVPVLVSSSREFAGKCLLRGGVMGDSVRGAVCTGHSKHSLNTSVLDRVTHNVQCGISHATTYFSPAFDFCSLSSK